MIRNIEEKDLDTIRQIHEQFFAKEFRFDDFLRGFISSFVITDDIDNDIISACSIRPIAEMVAVTNLNKSPRLRRNALLQALEVAQYTLRNTSMSQLHAFVQDEKWESQLLRSGFKKCVGNPVYINL